MPTRSRRNWKRSAPRSSSSKQSLFFPRAAPWRRAFLRAMALWRGVPLTGYFSPWSLIRPLCGHLSPRQEPPFGRLRSEMRLRARSPGRGRLKMRDTWEGFPLWGGGVKTPPYTPQATDEGDRMPFAGFVGCRVLPGFGFLPFLFVTEKEPPLRAKSRASRGCAPRRACGRRRSRWFRMQRTHDQRGFPPLESPEARYRPGIPAGVIPRPPDGRHLAAPSTLTPRCAPLRAGRGFCGASGTPPPAGNGNRITRPAVTRGAFDGVPGTYRPVVGRGLDPAVGGWCFRANRRGRRPRRPEPYCKCYSRVVCRAGALYLAKMHKALRERPV